MYRGCLIFILCLFSLQSFANTELVERARARKAQTALLIHAKTKADQGNLSEALNEYERALRFYISPQILLSVAEIFEKQGDKVNAQDTYLAYLSLTPTSSPNRSQVKEALEKLAQPENTLPGRFSRLVGAGRMVKIPAGDFWMGFDGFDQIERPKRKVTLSAFSVDVFEVTNQEYGRCVEAKNACRPSAFAKGNNPETLSPRMPVVGVTWLDAATYCAWAGKRLPTEAEWEKAARGEDGRLFPWGNDFSCSSGNFGAVGRSDYGCLGKNPGRVVAVGSYPEGASPYGVLDMAGNVQEWVQDWYIDNYYESAPSKDPPGPDSGEYRVVRGGNFTSPPSYVEATDRKVAIPDTYGSSLGFRCVLPEDPSFTPEIPASLSEEVPPTPPLP